MGQPGVKVLDRATDIEGLGRDICPSSRGFLKLWNAGADNGWAGSGFVTVELRLA